MSLQQVLRGTGVALVTPFDQSGEVDYPALKNLIHSVLDNGCEYVVTLGTTGETPVLTKEEKKCIIEFTYDTVGDKAPVVVGVGGNDTQALIHDLKSLPLQKATAVLSASPYYNKPSQEGIFQHYKALAAVSPKPILLYNVPGRTGRGMTTATVLRLAKEVPNIAGIKEASGDMTMCMQLVKDKPEGFLVVSGDDNLGMAQIACGMEGVISVVANCFPKLFSNLVRLALNNQLPEARKINDQLLEAYDLLFCENNPAGVKAFLAEQGMMQNVLRLPLVPLTETIHQKVKNYLSQLS